MDKQQVESIPKKTPSLTPDCHHETQSSPSTLLIWDPKPWAPCNRSETPFRASAAAPAALSGFVSLLAIKILHRLVRDTADESILL